MDTLFKQLYWQAIAGLLVTTPAFADDKRFDFDFNAGFGARYDSNVALVDLDNSAGNLLGFGRNSLLWKLARRQEVEIDQVC